MESPSRLGLSLPTCNWKERNQWESLEFHGAPRGCRGGCSGRVSLGRGQGLTGPLSPVAGSSEAEHRLFERLFEDYNEIIRPVANVSDPVIIQFEVSMSQLVKVVSARVTSCGRGEWGFWKRLSQSLVFCILCIYFNLPSQDEVNQIMETNLWLKQVSDQGLSPAAPWW